MIAKMGHNKSSWFIVILGLNLLIFVILNPFTRVVDHYYQAGYFPKVSDAPRPIAALIDKLLLDRNGNVTYGDMIEEKRIHRTMRHKDTIPSLTNIDLKRTVFKPWKEASHRTECRKFNVSFLKQGSNKLSLLASFPASGNTWTRFLIEGFSGIYTGSIWTDGKLRQYLWGEPEQPHKGTLIVTKTHMGPKPTLNMIRGGQKNKINKVILLIRNPFEALKSFYQWIKMGGHQGQLPDQDFRKAGYEKFATSHFKGWGSLIRVWMNYNESTKYVLFYEDLMSNLKDELIDLSNFLEVKPDPERFSCLLEYPEGHFHRKAKPAVSKIATGSPVQTNSSKKNFPVPMAIFPQVIESICEANDHLISHGFKQLPLAKYYKSLASKFSLDKEAEEKLRTLCQGNSTSSAH